MAINLKDLFLSLEGTKIRKTVIKTGEVRYCQHVPNNYSRSFHGSAVVCKPPFDPVSIEFWYKNWRIASVPCNFHAKITENTIDFIRLNGTLKKEGGRRKNVKKRWFVLNDYKLSYFQDEKHATNPIREILVSDIKNCANTADLMKIQVFTPSRTFVVTAEDPKTSFIWLKMITATQKLHEMVQTNMNIVEKALAEPENLTRYLHSDNYFIFQYLEDKSFFQYFIGKNNNIVLDLIQNELLSPTDFEQIGDYQKEAREWDPELCIALMNLAQKKSQELPINLVRFWKTKIEESDLFSINLPQFIVKDDRLMIEKLKELEQLKTDKEKTQLINQELVGKIRTYETKIQKKQKKITEIEIQNQQRQNLSSTENNELQGISKEDQLNTIKIQIEEIEEENKKSKEEKNQLNQEIKEKNQKINKLESDISKLKKELSQKKSESEQIQKNLNEKNLNSTSIIHEANFFDSKISSLETELKSVEKTISKEKKEQLEKKKSQITSTTLQNTETLRLVEENKKLLDELDQLQSKVLEMYSSFMQKNTTSQRKTSSISEEKRLPTQYLFPRNTKFSKAMLSFENALDIIQKQIQKMKQKAQTIKSHKMMRIIENLSKITKRNQIDKKEDEILKHDFVSEVLEYLKQVNDFATQTRMFSSNLWNQETRKNIDRSLEEILAPLNEILSLSRLYVSSLTKDTIPDDSKNPKIKNNFDQIFSLCQKIISKIKESRETEKVQEESKDIAVQELVTAEKSLTKASHKISEFKVKAEQLSKIKLGNYFGEDLLDLANLLIEHTSALVSDARSTQIKVSETANQNSRRSQESEKQTKEALIKGARSITQSTNLFLEILKTAVNEKKSSNKTRARIISGAKEVSAAATQLSIAANVFLPFGSNEAAILESDAKKVRNTTNELTKFAENLDHNEIFQSNIIIPTFQNPNLVKNGKTPDNLQKSEASNVFARVEAQTRVNEIEKKLQAARANLFAIRKKKYAKMHTTQVKTNRYY
ncbi:huntingtin interacting protein [Anaeramoeba ignava]|uniref:Huntingtin interacting protein n=1 Tax=Anaeramoeba ignava TaxID=1746090 RepID=A0A9Q0L5N7_ANAIG|nr:huntingtin interacting protein [Anaeramoeba ignava]